MDLTFNNQNFRALRFCVREYPSYTQMEEDINIVGSNPGKDFTTNDLMNALDYFNSLSNALFIVETINLNYPNASSVFERMVTKENGANTYRSEFFNFLITTPQYLAKSIKQKTGISPNLGLLEEENRFKTGAYARFLQENLKLSFAKLNMNEIDGSVDKLEKIVLPYTNGKITFSIFLYPVYKGKWTALCPELFCCISQGNSRIEVLNNLCFSISETLFINTLTNRKLLNDKIYEPSGNFSVDSDLYGPEQVCEFICANSNLDQIFMASKNIILRKRNSDVAITIPYALINSFTFQIIEKIIMKKMSESY